jgi:transitional endoplasmic reticulum ATPase
VGADLAALAREAAIRALRRYLPSIDLDEKEIPSEILDTLHVKATDFRGALRDVSPSAMREVIIEVTHIKWQDVGGLESAKEEIRETVEYPLTERQRFDDLGIQPPKGVLLYGPPGTGKTLIAKAVANESGANFIAIRGPQLLSKYWGESERAVRDIFKKARQVAPAIIFFDEMDAIVPHRGANQNSHLLDSVLNQILTEIDGLQELKDVIIMGATNRPDMIDPALLRAGRFDRLVYIGEPGLEDRQKIVRIYLLQMPIDGSALYEVINLTDGFDEAALESLIEKMGVNTTVTLDEARVFTDSVEKKEGASLDRGTRRKVLWEMMKQNGLSFEDPKLQEFIRQLAIMTEGYVGSDLELLCREAGMLALRERSTVVTLKHFESAKQKIHPTMNQNIREWYKKIQDSFKGGLPKEVQPPEYQ